MIKVTKSEIKINVNGTEFSLTEAEARTLIAELEKAVGKNYNIPDDPFDIYKRIRYPKPHRQTWPDLDPFPKIGDYVECFSEESNKI
jgi:hypothetical protein